MGLYSISGALVEITEKSAQVNGAEFHYLQAGCGPPLLLIHGLLGGAFCWRLNLPAFAERFTTYAVDLPGHGEAPAPLDGRYSMQAQAARLHSWLQQQAIGPIDVIAASWGGGVALFLAALNPGVVRSLVLAAPVNPWSEFGRKRVRFFAGAVGGTLLRCGMPFSRPLHLTALERMYGDPKRIPAGTLAGYSRLALRSGLARNIIQTLRSWEQDLDALPGAIERVKSPALLVWGTRDGAVDIRSAGVLRQKLSGSELAIIEGAGHLPFEETPQEFNRTVLAFLERDRARALPKSRGLPKSAEFECET
jgi:pimeloyl-ACP methyl ester carboxylesterase